MREGEKSTLLRLSEIFGAQSWTRKNPVILSESNLIPDLENPISPKRSLKFIRLLRVVY